jgi:uncharacterized protein (TIGR02145 family)
MKKIIPVILLLPAFLYLACGGAKPKIASSSVVIGTQVWTNTNLNVSTFRNGDAIPEAESDRDWITASKNHTPAWCYMNNDTANGRKYGKLYNWYAVTDSRGLAPKGWHVASEDEWDTLATSLYGFIIAGKPLKSTTGWARNGNGNNSTGFSALPSGDRSDDGPFLYLGEFIWVWTSSGYSDSTAWDCSIPTGLDVLCSEDDPKGSGSSVRCVKDK